MSEKPEAGGTIIVRLVVPEGFKPGDVVEAEVNLGSAELVDRVKRGGVLTVAAVKSSRGKR